MSQSTSKGRDTAKFANGASDSPKDHPAFRDRYCTDVGVFLSPRYREFHACISSDDAYRLAGIGMTPETVIEYQQDSYRRSCEYVVKHSDDPALPVDRASHLLVEHAATYDCLAIWEGNRIIAVMTPDPTGKPEHIVTRLDRRVTTDPPAVREADPDHEEEERAEVEDATEAPSDPLSTLFNHQGRRAVRARAIQRPLLRSDLTFAREESNPFPVTIQVLITDEGKEDFPELQEAGWGAHDLNGFTVHFRVVH